MTADFDSLPDLEEYDTMYKGFIDFLGGEMNDYNRNDFNLISPCKKPPLSLEPYQMISNSFFDPKQLPSSYMDWENPPLFGESLGLGFSMHDFNNAFIHSENEPEILDLVDPISCLPSPEKDEDNDDDDDEKYDFEDSLESVLTENLMDLTDEKLIKIVDSNFMSLDDILVKKPRKYTHLDFDHCYSIRPEGYYTDEDECYDSPPSPASSSCSDTTVKTSKRGRPPKKNTACKKIKQEPVSEDEEVDVEGPFTVSLLVPKTELTPPLSPQTPAKRGRKPKNKNQGQQKTNNKKTSTKTKNCAVSPKVLEEAIIKQQKKKNYVTKSGRVTKVSHSVESSPSTSTQSSQNSSRCSSDNEDTADKRASHNQAERQRRQQLTDLFQILRKRVPAVTSSPKASKVAILSEAAKYVTALEDIQRMRKLCKDQEKTELAKKLYLLQSLTR